MSRPNEFKVATNEFEDTSDALKALDALIKDVDKQKGDISDKMASDRSYRLHVGGLKERIDGVLDGSLEEWNQVGLDRSFCQRADNADRSNFFCCLRFIHPVYEQIWLSDPSDKNVTEELIPFWEIDIKYAKDTNIVALTEVVLEVSLHLPELSASFSSTKEDLELIKSETLRMASVNTRARKTIDKLKQELRSYCETHQLSLDEPATKGKQKDKAKADAQNGENKDEEAEQSEPPLASSVTEDAAASPSGDDTVDTQGPDGGNIPDGNDDFEYVDFEMDEITDVNLSGIIANDAADESTGSRSKKKKGQGSSPLKASISSTLGSGNSAKKSFKRKSGSKNQSVKPAAAK